MASDATIQHTKTFWGADPKPLPIRQLEKLYIPKLITINSSSKFYKYRIVVFEARTAEWPQMPPCSTQNLNFPMGMPPNPLA